MYDSDDYLMGALGMFMVMLVVIVAIGAFQWDSFRGKEREYVTDVCNYSRSVNTKESRKLCGDIQTKSNTEFLCNNDGKCWAETKQ